MSQRPKRLLILAALLLLEPATAAHGQNPPPVKKPVMGPPSPQSTHYPILLLVFGNSPNWNLRIGLKGPERLDRPNYPPITLEPAEVTHEAVADSWTYHARDSATGAAVAVHLSREACTDALNDTLTLTQPPGAKFGFRASVEHAQLGALKGCARIAPELFPKINNHPEDDEDTDEDKPPAPTVTNFKVPTAVAFVDTQGRVVMKRGSVVHVVAPDGVPESISHDGKQLLFRRLEAGKKITTFLYDFSSGKTTALSMGDTTELFWSLDDSRTAFTRVPTATWGLYITPVLSVDPAESIYSGEALSLQGWVDAHTVLLNDSQQLFWIGDDGKMLDTLALKDLRGESSVPPGGTAIRIHPLNSDLLLISPLAVIATAASKNPSAGPPAGMFLYEIRSKRRVFVSTPDFAAQSAEWSRDGLQIFFTGTDSSKRKATYRIFWDGTGLEKYSAGTHFVIGQ